MQKFKLRNMKKGWFIGDFNPTVFRTTLVETAYKTYKKGDYEDPHFHKIAKEITVIAEGEVEMNGVKYIKGDILVISPMEVTNFKALTDAATVVVKIPCIKDDKYDTDRS